MACRRGLIINLPLLHAPLGRKHIRAFGSNRELLSALLTSVYDVFFAVFIFLFELRFDDRFITGRADAVAEPGFRMGADITVDLLPVILVIANVLAVGADRES